MRGQLAFGLFLVGLGAAWIVDLLGYFTWPGGPAVWWPSLLVLLAACNLAAWPAAWRGSLFVAVIGVLLQAWRLDALGPGAWAWVGAGLLVALGILVMARPDKPPWGAAHAPRLGNGSVAVFTDVETGAMDEYQGGEVTAVFGKLRADLTRAKLPPTGAHLKATSVFGEVQVRVPEGWQVRIHGAPVFGQWLDRTRAPAQGAPVLDVEAVPVFGNVVFSN